MPEIWRVLAPGGRVVFIVPNRSGLWARRDVTPFGYGRPYSLGQMEALARKHRFEPERHAGALYVPPSHRKFWQQTAYAWERLGRRFDPRLVAGALLVEASKQVYARPSTGARVTVPGPLEVLEGLAGPAPEPVGSRGRSALRRDATR
jgi:SAM-dependent methyltransferase